MKFQFIQKIEELEHIAAEVIMERTISEFNSNLDVHNSEKIIVVMNIADDLKGSWTNFYTTDYASKFKLNALINRKFCVPYFWTSETYTEELITIRTKEYLSRTLYRIDNPNPKSLEDHLEQEIFVSKKTVGNSFKISESNLEETNAFYLENKNSEDYNLIFNFFYGDEGSENLGYKQYGNKGKTGFDYAKFISLKRKTPTLLKRQL